MTRVLIVGLGNRLLGDDGIGTLVAEKLQEVLREVELNIEINVEVLEHRVLDLAYLLQEGKYDKVLLIDACNIPEGSCLIAKLTCQEDLTTQSTAILDTTFTHGVTLEQLLRILCTFTNENIEIYPILVKPERIELVECISENVVRKAIECVKHAFLKLLNIDDAKVECIVSKLREKLMEHICR